MTSRRLLAAGLASAALVTACSSASKHAGHTAPTVPAATLPSGVSNAVGVPTSVPNNVAHRPLVQLTACHPAAGGWEASGTASNPGSSQTTYAITVFFTTRAATVIGFGNTTVQVGPGGHQAWTVSAKFNPAPGTRCVLRGVS